MCEEGEGRLKYHFSGISNKLVHPYKLLKLMNTLINESILIYESNSFLPLLCEWENEDPEVIESGSELELESRLSGF